MCDIIYIVNIYYMMKYITILVRKYNVILCKVLLMRIWLTLRGGKAIAMVHLEALNDSYMF